MGKTVISFGLSEKEIDRAIKELEEYKKDFEKKCEELRQLVAERIRQKAQEGFNGAIVDDLTAESGGARMAEVSVVTEDSDDVTLVIAQGTDAVWVEFGAGVYHNGAVGSSPNPYGANLGFTIGGFGENGKKQTWGFYENGDLKITHGTPATMPMFHAVQDVLADIGDIAKEVFE